MTTTDKISSTEVKADPAATVFSLKGAPVLSAGRHDSVLARTDDFVARVKVYAEGGENATHTHLNEEHCFLVVGGQATFHLGRDGEETVVANAYEGVFLPRGSFYRFESSGDENLVMFRVGYQTDSDRGRVGPAGRPLPGHSAENKHIDGVPVAGKFFAG